MMSHFLFHLSRKKKPKASDHSESEQTSETAAQILTQRQATDKILQETAYSQAADLEEMDHLARKRSDLLAEERQSRIEKFDPFSIPVNAESSLSLTSLEKLFLKQLHGQNIESPSVYAYWTYEYAVDFAETVTKLISNGFLTVGIPKKALPDLTVVQLKKILRDNGLPLSGKKQI